MIAIVYNITEKGDILPFLSIRGGGELNSLRASELQYIVLSAMSWERDKGSEHLDTDLLPGCGVGALKVKM